MNIVCDMCIKNIIATIKWSIRSDHRFPSLYFTHVPIPGVVAVFVAGVELENEETINMQCEWPIVAVVREDGVVMLSHIFLFKQMRNSPEPIRGNEKCLTIWGYTLRIFCFHSRRFVVFFKLYFHVLVSKVVNINDDQTLRTNGWAWRRRMRDRLKRSSSSMVKNGEQERKKRVL